VVEKFPAVLEILPEVLRGDFLTHTVELCEFNIFLLYTPRDAYNATQLDS